MTAAAKPLVVISSRTGNTMILGHAICDAMPGAVLVKPEALPEDLSGFNPILLGFWCDRGMAPEDIQAAAKKLEGKTIGCFATMGGNAETPEAYVGEFGSSGQKQYARRHLSLPRPH